VGRQIAEILLYFLQNIAQTQRQLLVGQLNRVNLDERLIKHVSSADSNRNIVLYPPDGKMHVLETASATGIEMPDALFKGCLWKVPRDFKPS